MLKTIFTIGLLTLVGLFALKIVFGILGGFFVILFALLGIALKVAIVGGIVYLVIRIFAPETAKEMREKFGA